MTVVVCPSIQSSWSSSGRHRVVPTVRLLLMLADVIWLGNLLFSSVSWWWDGGGGGVVGGHIRRCITAWVSSVQIVFTFIAFLFSKLLSPLLIV